MRALLKTDMLNRMNKSIVCWLTGFLMMLPLSSIAETGNSSIVYKHQVNKPVDAIYDGIYKSLEDARFYVVFEPNIGENLKRFAKKWGADYNQNKLSEIRSMVFCNGWYANQVSNLDPDMLGFCPLHISLIERDGVTSILFNRPGLMSKASPANKLLRKIEQEVIDAIEKGSR